MPTLRDGFKKAREVGYQAAMSRFRGKEVSPGPEVTTDAQIEAWIRKAAQTVSHSCATCCMNDGPSGVVDSKLRVKGIERLRVVDASAMPDIVSGHTNACVMMMAEKASDMILGKNQ